MNNLLLDEHPLIILPSLAKTIGLNESILLQQIHYWIRNSDKVINGKKWTYNTYDDWLIQFPFWSKSTLRRSIAKLEDIGILITDNFNKMKADKTKWYTIDYQKLRGLSSPCVQNEQSMCSKWTDGSVQNEQSNTLDYSKTSTENNDEEETVSEIIKFWDKNGFGLNNLNAKNKLLDWLDEFEEPKEIILLALEISTEQNVLKYAYVESILKNWLNKGAKTLNDCKSLQTERKSEINNKYPKKQKSLFEQGEESKQRFAEQNKKWVQPDDIDISDLPF